MSGTCSTSPQEVPHKRVFRCVCILSSTGGRPDPRLAATSGQSLAGLETFFPGQTDLALTNVQSEGSGCEERRGLGGGVLVGERGRRERWEC